jgi:dipeptidyl aminopeptidase/acylaminoacyl peptidase
MADPPDPALAERQKLVRLASDPIPPTRLWIAAVDSPEQPEALTPSSMNVLGVPEWSPDGSSIAFNHVPSTGQDAASQTAASVITLGTKERKGLRHIGQFPGALSFSPDGAWIALRASTQPSPGFASAAVYAIRVDDRETNLLGAADHLTDVAGWSPTATAVLVISQVGTLRHVIRYRREGTASDALYSGPLVVSSLTLSADRTMAAFVGESLDAPPEIYVTAVSPFKPKVLTTINDDVSLAPFGRTELIKWKSRDGKTIEGLLTYPVTHGGSRAPPLLVVAHGGGETFSSSYVASPFNPGSRSVGSRGAYHPAVFSSRGYAVLRANHRGGLLGGYGFDASLPAAKPEERANPDILGGIDLAVRMGVADPERLAIMGWSNGGLVATSLITNSDRFAAASLLAGFPFLEVQAGTGSWIPHDLGAEPWEDPQRYVDHSPSFSLHQVKSPTLIQHGQDDRGIPVAQARAFHGSLTKLGVPTELAIYTGMGHSPSTPRQVIDIVERNLAWFNRHVMKQ